MERVSVLWIFRACLLFILIGAVWGGVQAEQLSQTYMPGEVIVRYADIDQEQRLHQSLLP